MTLSRRHLLAGLGGLGTLTALAGCGAETSSDATPTPSSDTFPVSITHALGTAVVPAAPQRVVSVGITEQDPLLALGARPVGVTEWYGEKPFATWPWATDELGDARPEVLSTSDGFAYEKIAALRPDLIIGTNSGMKAADYAKLSAIAPTVAQQDAAGTGYFQSWVSQTTLIGAALGQPQSTSELVEAVRRRFRDAAATNPQFAGKKAIFLQGAFSEGAAIASPAGLGTDFLTDLGFTIPDDINPYVKDGAQAYVPLEKLDVLNAADVLIWATDDLGGREKAVSNPIYQRLEAVRDGRSIETGPELAGAIYFTTVLSLPYVVDNLVPMLSKALPT